MNPRATARRRAAGHLLIEALIALALAATVSSALLTLHLEVRRQGEIAALHATAAGLAEARIEGLLGPLRAGLEPGGGAATWPDPPDGAPRLAIEWTVLPGPGTTAALDAVVTRARVPAGAGDAPAQWSLAGLAGRGAAADSGWAMVGAGGP